MGIKAQSRKSFTNVMVFRKDFLEVVIIMEVVACYYRIGGGGLPNRSEENLKVKEMDNLGNI